MGCGADVTDTNEEAPDPSARSSVAPACIVHEGDLVLTTNDEVSAAANVGEVRGDLIIRGTELADLGPDLLPCLTAVRGSMVVGPLSTPLSTSVTLEALEVVDGGLAVGYLDVQSTATALAFPRLRRVGSPATPGGLLIGEAKLLERVELPALEEVHGDFVVEWLILRQLDARALRTVTGALTVGPATDLQSLDLRALVQVGGLVSLRELPQIPYSEARLLAAAAEGTPDISRVGCDRRDGDRSPDCDNP
jgi:hypothetical protein